MKEKTIERKLVAAVRKMGGLAPKFVSPGFDGMPDRIILLPGGVVGFVEVKVVGKRPRAIQLKRHDQLRELGFKVFVLDDVKQINEILEGLQNG